MLYNAEADLNSLYLAYNKVEIFLNTFYQRKPLSIHKNECEKSSQYEV